MRSLRWEAEARRQYRDSLTYIAAHDTGAAERLDYSVRTKLEALQQFPEIGRPGRIEVSRELVVHPNYIVIYTVRSSTIDIVRFLHVRQLYP
jgi:toxin ParE1/3/4